MRLRYLLLLALLASSNGQAEVYRCEDANGTHFADQPCGEDAEAISIRDNHIGGQFDHNLPTNEGEAPPAEPEDAEPAAVATEPASPCRFINSTELRTYLTREQVVVGMTREQVRRAFGRPQETYPVPQETWVYQTDYYNKLYELTYVYFRDGCVESVDYRKP